MAIRLNTLQSYKILIKFKLTGKLLIIEVAGVDMIRHFLVLGHK